MASRSQHQGFDAYTILAEDNSIQATFIPARGAVGASIVIDPKNTARELLFQHDTFWDKIWNDLPGGWPVCFPVCARLEAGGVAGAYRLNNQTYHLPIHGFAWSEKWAVSQHDASMIEMVLRDNANTFQQFPFHFEVILRYDLLPTHMRCTLTVKNTGKESMPYYAGFHPYFLIPENIDKQNVILDYQPIKRFQYNERLTDIVGEQPLFELPCAITTPEINEQLTLLGDDKSVRLQFPDMQLTLNTQGVEDPNLFPYVQLYTMPEQPFFSAEPWMGYPNMLNHPEDCHQLAPGASEQVILQLNICSSTPL